jgi:hypothetical protein
MTRADFTLALEAEPRLRGVAFNLADLFAFAEDGLTSTGPPDHACCS